MTVSILTGDCRQMLATLPAGSVQCCVTSPPYFGLRDYGHDGQIGLEPTHDAYVAEMVAVFREVRRVLRDDGTCWLNLGDSYFGTGKGPTPPTGMHGSNGTPYPVKGIYSHPGIKPKDLIGIPWLVAFALRADGWWLRQDIIWQKPNPMPESVTDRCTKAHEYVFLLTKSARYFYDAKAIAEESADPEGSAARYKSAFGGAKNEHLLASDQVHTRPIGMREFSGTRNRRSVWPIATQPYSGSHFATMPPELAETCIKAGSSERGQCPHCGAPWARQVERDAKPTGRSPADVYTGSAYDTPQSAVWGAKKNLGGDPRPATTTGWSPSCACPAHKPIPQTILDPFGGAGTTALVADRLQRDATIIELNPEYAALARDRINGEAGLFAPAAE